MAGMAALETRDAVRSCIKSVECNAGKLMAKPSPAFTGKTTNKQ